MLHGQRAGRRRRGRGLAPDRTSRSTGSTWRGPGRAPTPGRPARLEPPAADGLSAGRHGSGVLLRQLRQFRQPRMETVCRRPSSRAESENSVEHLGARVHPDQCRGRCLGGRDVHRGGHAEEGGFSTVFDLSRTRVLHRCDRDRVRGGRLRSPLQPGAADPRTHGWSGAFEALRRQGRRRAGGGPLQPQRSGHPPGTGRRARGGDDRRPRSLAGLRRGPRPCCDGVRSAGRCSRSPRPGHAGRPVPANGVYPTEIFQYERLFLDEFVGTTERASLSPRLAHSASPTQLPEPPGSMRPALGALVTIEQSWHVLGVALGQLLRAVALAPGESVRIAMVDWSRRTAGSRAEAGSEDEALTNRTQHDRAISEVASAVATRDADWRIDVRRQRDDRTGRGGRRDRPSEAAYSQGSTNAFGQVWSTSSGSRDVAAQSSQAVAEATQQAAAAVRNRRATVVQEVEESRPPPRRREWSPTTTTCMP